ncbi:MAG: hypothetical protein Q4P05_01990 [Actinomycetaceae bacterium]|nr:hypothetical protein [Actinomycetaceae bacterium]
MQVEDPHASAGETGNDDVVASGNSVKTLWRLISEQDRDSEKFLLEYFTVVLRLRGVRIDRAKFLTSELHKRGFDKEIIALAVETSPIEAGIPVSVVDEIAHSVIQFETRKSSAFSLVTGLPGLAGSFALMPTDITQFYIHAFRIIQKTAYAYGWQSLTSDAREIDDETLFRMVSFLGVMSGVSGASHALRRFILKGPGSAATKAIQQTALTKTVWYPTLKSTLKHVGVKVKRKLLLKASGKSILIVGGVVSGGLTFVTLNTEAKRLVKYFRETPPPQVNAKEYLSLMQETQSEDVAKKTVPAKIRSGAVAGASTAVTQGRKALSSTSDTIKTVAKRGANQVVSRVKGRRSEKSSHAKQVDYSDGDLDQEDALNFR